MAANIPKHVKCSDLVETESHIKSAIIFLTQHLMTSSHNVDKDLHRPSSGCW